jgi:hypothetical protein
MMLSEYEQQRLDRIARAQAKNREFLQERKQRLAQAEAARVLNERTMWEADASAIYLSVGGTLDEWNNRRDRLWQMELERRVSLGNPQLQSMRRSGRYNF